MSSALTVTRLKCPATVLFDFGDIILTEQTVLEDREHVFLEIRKYVFTILHECSIFRSFWSSYVLGSFS